MTSTMTSGISAEIARPIVSTLSDRPGPEVTVIDGTPPKLAPTAMLMAAISSSASMARPPTAPMRGASHSVISVAGVIG